MKSVGFSGFLWVRAQTAEDSVLDFGVREVRDRVFIGDNLKRNCCIFFSLSLSTSKNKKSIPFPECKSLFLVVEHPQF